MRWEDVQDRHDRLGRGLTQTTDRAQTYRARLQTGAPAGQHGASELGQGAVTVTLDGNGLPTVVIADDWRPDPRLGAAGRWRLNPDQIGPAVCQASINALLGAPVSAGPADNAAAAGEGTRPSAEAFETQFAAAVTELKATADAVARGPASDYVRTEQVGHVTVTVSRAGLEECVVDALWARGPDGRGLDGSAIAAEINQAMVRARALQSGLKDPWQEINAFSERIRSACADALAYLHRYGPGGLRRDGEGALIAGSDRVGGST
jgi:hypothetical protein